LAFLVFSAGCTYLERARLLLPRGVDRRVTDKEVVRIDKEVYVKVPNPEADSEDVFKRSLYVPVKDYLVNRGSYDAVKPWIPPQEEEGWTPVGFDPKSLPAPGEPGESEQTEGRPRFKKRLMILPFDDPVHPFDRGLSDSLLQSLTGEIQAMSDQVVLSDPGLLRQAEADGELDPGSFDPQETTQLAGQLYNVHAILTGRIDHVFVSSTESSVRGKGRTSFAIVEVTARLIDSASGSIRRLWERKNSIFDSEARGEFSEEKARLKALDQIAAQLAQDVVEELRQIDWYATIAGIDGNQVFISAGKRSGVRVGDIFVVYPSTVSRDPRGEVAVATLFGIDGSVGRITKGNGFRPNEIVRPVFR
jgi:hypothetical protein